MYLINHSNVYTSILNCTLIKSNASLLPRLLEGQWSFRPTRARAAPRVGGHVTAAARAFPRDGSFKRAELSLGF